MPNYAENMYNYLKERGYANKYEYKGVYCIKIDQQIVYIGKSVNMLRRIAQHYAGIQNETEKKYQVLSEARRRGHNINFDVLYYAKSRNIVDQFVEIGEKEGELIRKYNPVLNTQIPKAEDYTKYDVREIDVKKILSSL